MRLGFIGVGAAGSALARAAAAAGLHVAALASRRPERATALAAELPECRAVTPAEVVELTDIIFLTVPDGSIAELCSSLPWRPGTAAVHCSGALSLDVLEPAARKGATVGGCHPLQSMTGGAGDAALLRGSVFGIEAEEPLRARLAGIVEAIGGRPVFLSAADKALYHASAMVISGYTVTLAALAAGLWAEFGVEQAEGLAALLPLLRGTVDQLERLGLPGALSGPTARGDLGTIQHHLDALSRSRPDLLSVYAEVGRHTVPISRELGKASSDSLDAIQALLDGVARRRVESE